MSGTMRVVRARDALSLDAYRIEEEPAPVPGEGQVCIRVRACGFGFVDALTAAGRYQVKPPLPFTPGVEVAGEVVAVGPGVRGSPLGARVVPMISTRGALAEQVLAPAAQLASFPTR